MTSPHEMHFYDEESDELAMEILAHALERVQMDPPPLDGWRSLSELERIVGQTIRPEGRNGLDVLREFLEVLAPACISVDHPLYLSFVPGAPTESSVLFDLLVSASNIYGGSWLEASGAVYAENQALRWLADIAGLPPEAGGVFVSGGSAGNLSALIAARYRWRDRANGALDRVRPLLLGTGGAHSSIAQAAQAMDADYLRCATDGRGRAHGAQMSELVASLSGEDRARVCALVATSGTTNLGVIDDLAGIADVADEMGTWLHIDGAYGAAALCAPSVRPLFTGIERCDSMIVDPHKWLFAPYDCCALIYRDPSVARRAHTQHAEYLDVLKQDVPKDEAPNPADLAHHLSRRTRGLPFWFSLAMHGTEAYTDAMEETLRVAREVALGIEALAYLELLMQPELSVVVFRRRGWSPEQYQQWSNRQLAEGRAFIVPSHINGETMLRLCIVNPRTTVEELLAVLRTLE
jgi:glutamate/tyrosine decarboxylase-like PLP-dependent enzyme